MGTNVSSISINEAVLLTRLPLVIILEQNLKKNKHVSSENCRFYSCIYSCSTLHRYVKAMNISGDNGLY